MNYIFKDRQLTLLFTVTFLFFFNETLLMPTLPLYLAGLAYSNLAIGTVLLLAAMLYGIGTALYLPTLTALLADHSEPGSRGSIFSFFFGAFDLSMLSAGVVLGFVADIVGLRNMFLISAGLGILATLFFLLMIRPGCRDSIRWVAMGNRSHSKYSRPPLR
jgi:MFS family permease